MILADVNVLVGAFRADSKHHAKCKPWLDRVLLSDAPFGVSPLVLAAVIRVTTTPAAFPVPTTLELAFAFCNALRNQPHCVVVEPGERHWPIFERLCKETRTTSGDITDVWYAALAIEHDCTWITLDRDFAKYPGLNWKQPN